MSLFWFDFLRDIVPNHVITADVDSYPADLHAYRDQLEGRSMLVKRCRMEPIECVARGYVSGSGWKDYKRTGAICGIPLPAGLLESEKLAEPVFTPATKAESGHDENIPLEEAERIIGRQTAALLRDLTLRVYSKAADYALSRGLSSLPIQNSNSVGASPVRMPESFCSPMKCSPPIHPASGCAMNIPPRGPQKSFDKQFVRDYLETLDWNKQPPAPSLPQDVIDKTAEKYRDAYTRLTGNPL